MLTTRRHAHILDRLRRDGQAIAKTIALELDVSEDTIRRDMRELAAEGLLKRVHGGAMPLTPELPDLAGRQAIATDIKQALARKAAELIRPGQLVFLDGGTTAAAIARALPPGLAVTIATHSPTIAAILETHALADVILIGGRIYKHSMVAVGASAVAMIEMLRPDIFFMGATAVHPAHGASTGDFEEAAIKRLVARLSGETYLPITEDKLDRASPHRILPLNDLTGLIFPTGIDAMRRAAYETGGAPVIEASDP